jgi:hypothetical protein
MKPGEQIKGWTIRDITTSELSCGATCHAPAYQTRLGTWDGLFS